MGNVELSSTKGENEVVVELNGIDNIEIGIEDTEEKIDDMVCLFSKALAHLTTKIGFEVNIETTKFAKARLILITLRLLCITLRW